MSEQFVGEIRMFAGNFAPLGWAVCDGQLLPIAQHITLFAIIGTTFGGDGQTSFALPDLRGRVHVHQGTGSGLTYRALAASGGAEAVTLTAAQMPNHTHTPRAKAGVGTSSAPTSGIWAGSHGDKEYAASADTTMSVKALTTAGGGEAHANMPPFLCVNFIIALEGIFPSRP